MKERWWRGTAIALVLGLCPLSRLAAYESDQYTHRLQPIADCAVVLDARVNQVIAEVAAAWRGPRNPWRFATQVYWRLGGLHWVDKIERFAMRSPSVEKLPQHRRQSIFAGAPFYATRVNFVFGVGRTIRLADVLVGSDKLGHFFSQGLKYYQSHLQQQPEQKVLGRGRFNERWFFGLLTTGAYSNADLVANYEGYRFYRSLFEPGIVPGKGAILRWEGERPVVQRPFAWADHVNDFWDEALNPSYFGHALQGYMDRALPSLCGDYWQAPAAFVPRRETALAARYAALGLRPALRNRLDQVCASQQQLAHSP